MNETKKTNEFELTTLWRVLRKFWVIVLAATLVFAILGGVYASVSNRPVYTGKATFWVNSNTTTSAGVNQSNIMGAAQMATNYVELAGQDILSRRAVQSAGLAEKWNMREDDAVRYLQGMISATKADADSLTFSVSVHSYDQQIAYDSISAVQYAMIEVVAEVQGDSVTTSENTYITLIGEVLSDSDINSSVASPVRAMVLAALFALVVSYGVCFIIYIFDKRLRDDKMLLSMVAYPIMSVIPAAQKQKDEQIAADLPHNVKEAYNVMKTGVLSVCESPFVIAVSPVTNEYSATEVAQNLAAAIAESGKKALCIGYKKTDGMDFSYTEGNLAVSALELSGKDGYYSSMKAVSSVNSLKTGYDAVILDLPCVEDISDVGGLGAAVDGYILAAYKGADTRKINASLNMLESVDSNIIGFCYAE